MRRANLRRELLVSAGLLALLAVLATFSFRGASGASSPAPPSARPTAVAFAQAYVSYLDGRTTAGRLTASSPRVEAIARSGGVIPARDRDGALALTRVDFSAVRGASRAKASLVAGDRRHTLQALLSLAYLGGHWQVSDLVPPDLSTLLAPPAPPNRVPRAARGAAARFALAYADYREGVTSRLPPGLAYIRRQIATGHDPLANIQATRSRPRLVSLLALDQGELTSVQATVVDLGRRISFGFILQRSGQRWPAWQFPVSGQ